MSGLDLDPALRLQAHALLDRLVGEGATFSSGDARRLIALVPMTRASRFSFVGTLMGRGGRLRGDAAGVGPVDLAGEARDKRLSWRAPRLYRLGGYEVTHTPGEIGISLMWHETRIDQSGQSCVLVYDAVTGEPREMLIARERLAWVVRPALELRLVHCLEDAGSRIGKTLQALGKPFRPPFPDTVSTSAATSGALHFNLDTFMTTLSSKPKPIVPVPTAAMIADALSDAVIGQDPTLAALATAVHDQLTRDQPGRPGIFLLAGPDAARAKDAIAHALADVLGYDWGLYNLADPDLTAAQLFRSGPSGPRSGSLSYQLMSAPHSVIVLDAIERADPPALERLIAGWRSGVILDNAGEGIPTDAAVFLLTSAVAPARLGQIGRDDLSADQRHLACLKILSEEGVPAGLLRCVDAAFCLQGLTMRDLAQICRRRLEQQVAAHGLSLTEDGLSAEVLTCAMTSALGVSALAFQHRCVALDRRLAQCRSDGARAVRMVMDGDEIGVVPVEPADAVASAPSASNP